MSHFAVLVVGPNPEEQLAPYQENNIGDCPEEYLKFEDKETEMLEEYNTGSTEMAIMPDGRVISKYDDECYGKVKTGEIPTKTVPFKEAYPTFEQFAEDYHGYEKRNEKTGRYGYFENPNKKWDWYVLGGRYTGHLHLKKNVPGTKGKPGLMTEVAKDGTGDMAYKKDIDFDSMRKEAADEARSTYRLVNAEFEGKIPVLDIKWSDVIDPKNEIYNKLDHTARREMYHAQPAMKEWNSRRNKYMDLRDVTPEFKKLFELFTWGDLEKFQCTEEVYVKRATNSAITTFAVVIDGKWYERGSMHWFAIVTDEKADWDEEFSKMIDSVSDDTLISVYDCHI